MTVSQCVDCFFFFFFWNIIVSSHLTQYSEISQMYAFGIGLVFSTSYAHLMKH